MGTVPFSAPIPADFWPLLDAACADELTENQAAALQSHLESNPAARRVFIEHIRLRTNIRQWRKGERSREAGLSRIQAEFSVEGHPDSVDWRAQGRGRSAVPPLFSPLSTPGPSAFIGGPVFSYMVATLILGVMLLGAWAYTITHYQQVVVNDPLGGPSSYGPEMVFVGRVTGMKGCRWSDPDTITYPGSSVPLGRRYALSAGLMEITYETGAKVILEGPCTYKVESRAGGYLTMGKLTARVEKRSEVRGQNPRPKTQDLRPQSEISKFSVRTPTAIVTDLGTEFGVEVNNNGDTTSYVFVGTVKVQVLGEGNQQGVVLHADQAARVEKGQNEKVRFTRPAPPPQFVRTIYQPPKLLDLLDIVAGGRGTNNRRECGINPETGMQDLEFFADYRDGDRQFRPVYSNPMIDGVFVPDGHDGAVQLDSAGHVFDGFPETNGKTYGSIWPREADIGTKRIVDRSQPWVYATLEEERFMPQRRGLLCFYANGGITFNLEVMRKFYPGVRPARFRAVAGLAECWYPDPARPDGLVDLWVFVDGRLVLKQEKVTTKDKPLAVDVPLGPKDRFLTLVATDGGNGISWDSVVFGDPVVEMAPSAVADSVGESAPRNRTTNGNARTEEKQKEAAPMEQ